MKNIIDTIKTNQANGQKVVLTTGVFDLLHIEHLRFLAAAKQCGDVLIVGLETDVRVKQIKGSDRPINPEQVRLEQLRYLKPIDYAFLLPANFDHQQHWEQFMSQLKPDIYAVSAHTNHLENKKNICEKYGVSIQIVRPQMPDYSSSQLLQKILRT